MLQANGVELCVDSFGDRADSAILLIAGSSASMDWWEPEFCERLAAGPRFVIRYDLRDTGRSVSYEPGSPGYTLRELVEDAVGLLDALEILRADLVGASMGSGIAQLAALDHPERAASLTLLESSPAGSAPDLPSMSEKDAERFQVPDPDWSNREAVIEYVVQMERACAGEGLEFDQPAARRRAARLVDRSRNVASALTNHNVMEHGDGWRERLAELEVPTLVIHGTDDPVLPLEHGLALEREITGAKLVTLERTGHEIPRRTWDVVVPAILEHTGGAPAA